MGCFSALWSNCIQVLLQKKVKLSVSKDQMIKSLCHLFRLPVIELKSYKSMFKRMILDVCSVNITAISCESGSLMHTSELSTEMTITRRKGEVGYFQLG